MMSNILEMFTKNKKKLLIDTSRTYSLKDRDSTQIQKVFRYIDENGDGKISAGELERCVKAVGAEGLTAEEAAAAVEWSDSDGDGFLSLEDFQRIMDCKEDEKREDLREVFLMYNESGSGVITPKSLKIMLSRLGDSKSIHDCKDMIRAYDLNGDGVLSFNEFALMMR